MKSLDPLRSCDPALSIPKRCAKCLAVKARSDFYRASGNRPTAPRRLHSWCKACFIKRGVIYSDPNSEKYNRHGIGHAQFVAMFAAQNGRCAICDDALATGRGKHNVDHCHKSGRVRGLLCRQCNQGLGFFIDDPTLIQSAIAYLRRP